MAKYELYGDNLIDLSHTFETSMAAAPTLPQAEHEYFSRIGENGRMHNIDTIKYCMHTGTHMDAPYHVIADGHTIDTTAADVMIGPAAVVKLNVPEGDYAITRGDITAWEAVNGALQEGDGVLLHTGHDKNWALGAEKYVREGYPHLDITAAEYLVEKKVRYVALESISVDTKGVECHQMLLGNDIAIIENVCNLDKIPSARCFTVGTFPAITGASGTWVRLLALI